MKFLDVAVAIVVAFVAQTVLGRYFAFMSSYLDLFTVIAATFGLVRGRLFGMSVGTVAGLIQDAFSGGLLGLNGITKTIVGYVAGIAGHHLIVRGLSSRLLFFAAATVLDLALLSVVSHLVELAPMPLVGTRPLYICLGNAAAGILLLRLVDRKRPADSL